MAMSTMSARDLHPEVKLQVTTNIGPGSYDVTSAPRQRRGFVGFSSTSARTLSLARNTDIPGPGSYLATGRGGDGFGGGEADLGRAIGAVALRNPSPSVAPSGPGSGLTSGPGQQRRDASGGGSAAPANASQKGPSVGTPVPTRPADYPAAGPPRAQANVFRSKVARMAPVYPGSTVFRPSSVAENPGPGQYNVTRTLVKTPAARAMSASDLRVEVVNPKRNAPSIPRTNQSWGYAAPVPGEDVRPLAGPSNVHTGLGTDTVGPGQYEVSRDLVKPPPGGTVSRDRTIFARTSARKSIFPETTGGYTPGPGAYEAPKVQDAAVAGTSRKGNAAFASSTVRMDLEATGSAKGSAAGGGQAGLSSSHSSVDAVRTMIRKARHTPGPGAYLQERGVGQRQAGAAVAVRRIDPKNGSMAGVRGAGEPVPEYVAESRPLYQVGNFGTTSERGGWDAPNAHPYGKPKPNPSLGPGTYDTRSSSFNFRVQPRLNPEPVPFSSTDRRKVSETTAEPSHVPGPGSYNLQHTGVTEALERRVVGRNGVFGSTARRFRPGDSIHIKEGEGTAARAPAAEQGSPLHMSLIPADDQSMSTLPSASTRRGQRKGFGAFRDANRGFDNTQSRKQLYVGASRARPASRQPQRARQTAPTQSQFKTPPPGAYDVPTEFGRDVGGRPQPTDDMEPEYKPSFLSSSSRFTEGKLFNQQLDETPGPGAYEYGSRRRAKKSAHIGRAMRFGGSAKNVSDVLGPGRYDVGGELVKKSYNVRFQSKDDAVDRRMRQRAVSLSTTSFTAHSPGIAVAGEAHYML